MSNIGAAIISELNITKDEATAYVQIVVRGSTGPESLASALGWEVQRAEAVAKSLVTRGMVIELSADKYESLHPRFAITNRYRKRCQEEGLPFKKNLKVDNIGIVLEKPYEDARTK